MGNFTCAQDLSHLEYLRGQVKMYTDGLTAANSQLGPAIEKVSKNPQDPAPMSALDGVLAGVSNCTKQIETYLDAWETAAKKFAKEILAPAQAKAKKDKKDKKLAAACGVLVGHHTLHQEEVNQSKDLLAKSKPFYQSVVDFLTYMRGQLKKSP